MGKKEDEQIKRDRDKIDGGQAHLEAQVDGATVDELRERDPGNQSG